MPIITVQVPASSKNTLLVVLRDEIKKALVHEGINQDNITVEFPLVKAPDRLVVVYFTRSEHVLKIGQGDREAKIIAQLCEKLLELPVECLVVYIDKGKSGIFLT